MDPSDDYLLATYLGRCQRCRICRNNVVWAPRVNCDTCLAAAKARKAQKKAERDRFMAMIHAHSQQPVLCDFDDDIEGSAVSSSSGSSPASDSTGRDPGLAPAVLLKDLEGAAKETAVRLMKNHVYAIAKRRGPYPDRPRLNPERGTEYQTADELYKALKVATSTSKNIAFKGFHTIVASKDINRTKRLKLVARDLREVVRLSFDHKEPLKRNPAKGEKFKRATYRCQCGGRKESTGPLSTKKMKLENGRVEKTCGGRVRITVQWDSESHPLGVVGQMIEIRVRH